MAAVGHAILNSTFLPAGVTRRWMKPATHTSSLEYAVGMPWEIYSFSGSRVIDLYTKGGDLGLYSSMLALSPDHNVGFTILAAGEDTDATVMQLSDQIATTIIPALEQAAKNEARKRFAGTYTLNTSNSSITITTDRGPGLKVTRWISGSKDMLGMIAQLDKLTDPSLLSVRLYPTGLENLGQVSFRAIIQALSPTQGIGPFSRSCITWQTVDSIVYGNVGLDEFIFYLNNRGDAVSVSPRALRVSLPRA